MGRSVRRLLAILLDPWPLAFLRICFFRLSVHAFVWPIGLVWLGEPRRPANDIYAVRQMSVLRKIMDLPSNKIRLIVILLIRIRHGLKFIRPRNIIVLVSVCFTVNDHSAVGLPGDVEAFDLR